MYIQTVLSVLIIISPRRSRSTVAYSRQTISWTIWRSVCLSSALWEKRRIGSGCRLTS